MNNSHTDAPTPVAAVLEQRLRKNLPIVHLALIDDSASHAGHAGAMSGGSHLKLLIVSDAFQQKTAVERHRQIYSIMGDMIGQAIHAIVIDAKTPQEWAKLTAAGASQS